MLESKQISLGDFGHQCELLGRIKENLSMTTKSGAQISVRIGTFHFRKVCFRPLRFYERSTLVPALANWKKLEEDFQFYEHRWKRKWPFSVSFVEREKQVWRQHTPEQRSKNGTTPLLPWDLHSASQHHTPRALNVPVSICALSQFILSIYWPCYFVLYLNLFCVSYGNCFFNLYHFSLQMVSKEHSSFREQQNLYTGMHMSLSWHYILPSSFIKTFII